MTAKKKTVADGDAASAGAAAGPADRRVIARESLIATMRKPPVPGEGACPPGAYGTRDDWYDERGG